MEISIVACLFVLDSKKNENKKKNDIKTLKVLVKKDDLSLVRSSFDKDNGIKKTIRSTIKEIVGSDKFHLEQVYTLGENRFYEDGKIDIIYMGLMNIDNVKKLDENYELVDFSVVDNKKIKFGNEEYSYRTDKKLVSGSLEYTHKIRVSDVDLEKKLLELITVYKHLRFRIDSTDICFKLLPEMFTLEDVRIVYEMIKDVSVDKSNFRKKIIKYCKKADRIEDDKGYRPSQKYMFDPEMVEDWL